MIKKIAVLILSLFAGAALAEELSGVLMTKLHQAQEYEQKQQWGELEFMARDWTSTDGANWESWYYYGYAQLRLGKTKEAVQALTTARKLSPRSNDKLLLLIASAYEAISDFQSAEKVYRQLLKRYPNNATVWDKLRGVMENYLRMDIANRVEIEQELITILKKQLTFAGHINDFALWQRYVELLLIHDSGQETRRAHTNLLRLKPDVLAAVEWIFRYDLQHAEKETLEQTINHLEILDKNNPLLHVYYAKQALAENNKRRASEHYERISENTAYPHEQAIALAGLGDLQPAYKKQTALNYYKRAIAVAPEYLYPWEQIVIILRGYNNHHLAQRYFIRLRHIKKLLENGEALPEDPLQGLEG